MGNSEANDLDDELTYRITLNCRECENDYCPQCPIGTWVDENQGCVRTVDEDLYIDYLHQINEEQAFYRTLPTKEMQDQCYENTINILYRVYKSKLKCLITNTGKENDKKQAHAKPVNKNKALAVFMASR